MTTQSHPKFEYNASLSYDANFNEWLYMTNEERSMYNEDLMSREEGRQIFEKMYNNGAENG
jgi:hypothetical protein